MDSFRESNSGKSVSERVREALVSARTKLEAQELAMSEPIAVVGIGCRFPGGADSPEKFWQLLRDGVDCVGEVPRDRWDVDQCFAPAPAQPGKTYLSRGGFLENLDRFDAAFFGISPREAMSMDPQHRLLLEVGWEALEHAGIAPDSLKKSRTGVFLGICQNDYANLELNSGNLRAINTFSGTGNLGSFAPGRLAHVLGLQGPTMAIDTACSSSLVSVHLACNALRNREADAILAGGVHLILTPEMCVFLSASQALSPDGCSRTFDASANGFSRGEGCGVVVLKRLSDALSDGDSVLASIRGSAVNHDGPSGGLTVPSELAQARVIRQALLNARADPRDIGYVEAHGTGTALGDPIELEALGTALCRDRMDPLLVGSVKTNTGHLEGAAGIIGLIKVVLSLEHGEIPPHLHFETPNPRIDWDRLPIEVPTGIQAWPESCRLAGLSSFGMSGINAHLIVEGPGESAEPKPSPGAVEISSGDSLSILPLSAKSEAALDALTGAYAAHLSAHPDLTIGDVCRTAATGRAHLRYRLAILAANGEELRAKLEALRAGSEVEGVYTGIADSREESVSDAGAGSHGDRIRNLAESYVRGGRIDWHELYPENGRARVILPTYPFQRESYWVEPVEAPGETDATIIGQRLRLPFSEEIRFETIFSAESPGYVRDHLVFGAVVVPAASHLAMVLAGVREAFGSEASTIEDAFFARALVIASGGRRTVQLVFSSLGEGLHSFQLVSRESGGEEVHDDSAWIVHATGKVVLGHDETASRNESSASPDEITGRCGSEQDGGLLYESLRKAGFDLGPSFQWAQQIWRGPAEVLCKMRSADPGDASTASPIDPGLLDSCFQLLSDFWEESVQSLADSDHLYVPFRIASLRFHQAPPPGRPLWCHAEIPGSGSGDAATPELRLVDSGGNAFLEVSGFEFRKASREAMIRELATGPGNWIHEIEWIEGARPLPESVESGRRWLVFADASDCARRLVSSLKERNECIVVASRSDSHDEAEHRIDPLESDDYRELFESTGPVDRIVHFWSASLEDPADAVGGCEGIIHLVRALDAAAWEDPPQVTFVTRGVQVAGPNPSTPRVAQAPVWGLVRVLQLEHSELRCIAIDLPDAPISGESEWLIEFLRAPGQENQVALRESGPFFPRLIGREERSPDSEALEFDAPGSYLISGGLGELGMRVARWMVEKGARNLILAGRNAPSPTAAQSIRHLESLGATIRLASVDVSDAVELERMLEASLSGMPQLRGVVHAAGVLDDAILLRQDRGKLQKVFAPKVQGAWNLHNLTKHLPLDFMVFFSSTASMFGSRGQANYAAANAFLDALAHYRRSLALPALSINWGPWADMGMAARVEHRSRFAGWNELGMSSIEAERGLEILGDLLRQDSVQVGVIGIEWAAFQQNFLRGAPAVFFENLQRETDRKPAVSPSVPPPGGELRLIASLDGARPAEYSSILIAFVKGEVAEVLRSSPEAIDLREGLFDAGLDSLLAIELKEQLEAGTGMALPKTLVFDYPTVDALVAYLTGKLKLGDPGNDRADGDSETEEEEREEFQIDLDLDRLLEEGAGMDEGEIAREFARGEVGNRNGGPGP